LPAAHGERVHAGYLVIDLMSPSCERAGLEVFQSKYLYHERHCRCEHWSRAEPGHCADDPAWRVALSERHLAGPTLVVLVCALSLRMRLSRRRIQEFFADWFSLQLSMATIDQWLHEAGRAVEPVLEEQLLAEIRHSDLLHADETSWKEHGRRLWLWVFTCATTTVFTIGRRSQDVLHNVLGTVLNGWLMSDGCWAYRDYDQRLRCLTHLLRKARGLEESLERQAQALRRSAARLPGDGHGRPLRRARRTARDAAARTTRETAQRADRAFSAAHRGQAPEDPCPRARVAQRLGYLLGGH
jgi:transposase